MIGIPKAMIYPTCPNRSMYAKQILRRKKLVIFLRRSKLRIIYIDATEANIMCTAIIVVIAHHIKPPNCKTIVRNIAAQTSL